jgi:hypothetical protein
MKINDIHNFIGYENFRDITNQDPRAISAGSLNVFIPDGDKVEPRAGMDYFGAASTTPDPVAPDAYWTLPLRIHSKYDDFINVQGVRVPLRVWYSGNTTQGDVVEAYLPVGGVIPDGGVTNSTPKAWYQISSNTGDQSAHRYYWAEWWDQVELQSRVVFTFGKNFISSWSGGFAPIVSITGTTITTDTTWAEKGFIDSPEGSPTIIINGEPYSITSGDYSTDTITVADTTGITAGDIAFQSFEQESPLSNTIFDVCSMIGNQVYYLDWRQRNVYISWNRNQTASTTITDSAILADLNYSGVYNGSSRQTISVKIDGIIEPPIRTFSPFTAGNSDVIVFSGTHTGPDRDIYRVEIVGAGPSYPVEIYLNGALVTSTLITTLIATPFDAGNGIFISAVSNNNIAVGDAWTYEIGGEDTYTWYIDGVLQASGVGVTTDIVNSGVTYSFTYPSGHALGDSWLIINQQTITRGWSDFTYDNPNRLPGQGFTLLLDSNGWTMTPQESSMLINAQAGHYYEAVLTLSADLLSESVTVERLKSEPQNKILYPYLIGYIKNQIASISQDKTYDVLGRQKFLQLQQTKSISDKVRIDFETADWEDADILYFKRKIYFCLPKINRIFVYDDYKRYWHSPQSFGRKISLLSVIDDTLVGHSYEKNESYELYTGMNDLGLFPISTKIVFPYMNFGQRYGQKQMTFVAFEGYITGNPQIEWTLNAGLGGCEGQENGIIAPQNTPAGLCLPTDTASLGLSSLGFHGLGNSPSDVPPHFYYIKPFGNMVFFMRNIELTCNSLEQRWAITSCGTDVQMSNINSESITDNS